MKKIITLFISLLLMNTYNAQQPSVLKNFDLNTKTLDWALFQTENSCKSTEKLTAATEYINETTGEKYYDKQRRFFLKNNVEVFQFLYSDSSIIEERITRKDDPYSIERQYYYSNGKISSIQRKFHGFNIGKSKSYDINGKLEKEYDYEYGYKFSVEDLTKKMWKEYNIYLDSHAYTLHSVDRNYTEPNSDTLPQYTVIEYDSKYNPSNRTYTISGITGETLQINEYIETGENEKGQYLGRNYIKNGKGEMVKIIEVITAPNILDPGRYVVEEKVIFEAPQTKTGIYKTYKGRNYTEKEWQEFEAKEYQKQKQKKTTGVF